MLTQSAAFYDGEITRWIDRRVQQQGTAAGGQVRVDRHGLASVGQAEVILGDGGAELDALAGELVDPVALQDAVAGIGNLVGQAADDMSGGRQHIGEVG